MKKVTSLLLVIIFLFSLCSCNSDVAPSKEQAESLNQTEKRIESSDYNEEQSERFGDDGFQGYSDYESYMETINTEYEKSDNFIIYTDENHTGFIYKIIDNYGYEIDSGYHDYRGSFKIYEESGLLVLNYGFGGNSWQERFYDIDSGKVSRFFPNPLATYNQNIAYFIMKPENNEIYLIVQNIFDSSFYYEEVLWEYSSAVLRSQPQAQFVENGTKIKISYYEEDGSNQTTQLIDLSR